MTFPTVHGVSRSAVIDSPIKPPTAAATAAAIRALARAVDLDIATVARFADGSTRTDVSTLGLSTPIGGRIWAELLAGMTGVETGSWTVGPLSCVEASGLLLGARVRVTATVTQGQVSA